MIAWHVYQTKPGQESLAAEEVGKQGFEILAPRFLRLVIDHGRRHLRPRPLFPGYGFVKMDPRADQWRCINGTRGVIRLICQGDVPMPVNGPAMSILIGRISADGYYHDQAEECPWLRYKGRSVRAMIGPWATFAGIVEKADTDRLIVMMSLFGRAIPVEMDYRHVEIVA